MHENAADELRDQRMLDDFYAAARVALAGLSKGSEWRPAISQFAAAMLRDVSPEAQGRSAAQPLRRSTDRPLLRAV